MVLRLWAKAHSAASPFLQLHPEAEPADQAGRLNPTGRAPLGPNAGEILPPSQIWTSNVAWHQLLDLPVQHALLSDVDTQAPHTRVHTNAHTQTHHSLVQTARSWGLCCSISPLLFIPWFFLYLGRSRLGPLLPAITLLLALSYLHLFTVIPAPPCFILPFSLFISLSLCLACQALNI